MDENIDNRWDQIWFSSFCTENEIARIINTQKPIDFLLRERAEKVADNAKIMGECLEEYLSDNYNRYDFYSSCYLDEPNTQWCGKQLINRVDY